jgi:hypothetical protein
MRKGLLQSPSQHGANASPAFAICYFGNGTIKAYRESDLGYCTCGLPCLSHAWGWGAAQQHHGLVRVAGFRTLNLSNKVEKSPASDAVGD